jgi:hypothetical protein
MSAPDLVVRRSRMVAGLNAAMAAAVTVAAAWFGVTEARGGGTPWYAVGMVVVLMGFYASMSLRHFLDTTPLLVVGPDGLGFPQSADAPIPWRSVTRLGAARSFALVGGGRLDIELEPEALVGLRLGQRLMGDPLVKMVGVPYGISLNAQGLDHRASDILAAIGRHWPPRDPAED